MTPRTRRWGRVVLLLWALIPVLALAGRYEGRVVRVIDGDTVETLDSARTLQRVRLSGIDAPERKQAFGTQAKQRLTELVGGQAVVVDWDKRDRYGRVVGTVSVAGRDVGLTLVQEGYAWWYRRYAADQGALDVVRYGAAELTARRARRGLWQDPAPQAPWDFRR